MFNKTAVHLQHLIARLLKKEDFYKPSLDPSCDEAFLELICGVCSIWMEEKDWKKGYVMFMRGVVMEEKMDLGMI